MSRVTTPPLSGVLLGDQGDSSIAFSDKIYLLVDQNGDGDAADAGERIVFFDETNAAGLGGEGTPTGNILNLTQASDLAVYAGDGDTDAVYRLRDLNNDGDANDEGEATLWFSEADNAAGFTLPTPNGIAEGPDGAIYIVNAGVSSRPADAIYRTVDLNGDGDANDEGEATVWLDLTTLVPTSSPYDLSFIGDRGYLIDPSGGAEDSIYTFRDDDGSGTIEADEFSVFATKTATGATIDFTAAADGESMIVWEWLDRDTGTYSIYRFTDLNGSGDIDEAGETVEIWNTDQLPGVFDTFAGFSIAADGEGRIALTSNDSGAFGDNVYILEDLNGDGDYFDVGETNVLASRAFDEDTLQRPRSVAFYEGAVERSDTTVSAGNHFSLFLDTETNTVYASGENVLGQLGQGVKGFDVAAPLEVALPEGFSDTIVSVAAGLIHGSFLTESGDVYTWGFGNIGRLGHGDEEDRLIATKVEALDDETVVVVDHGNGASYAITETGTLYGWGHNASGQLGLGDEEERHSPTEIDIEGKTIVAVSAGTSHTLALASDGSVYGFGSNVDGQVGDPTQIDGGGDPIREILTPVKVEGLPSDIVAVTADTQTSFAVTSDGRLFGWGENSFGQLLVGTDNGDGTFVPTDDKVLAPIELEMPRPIVDVKGGARWVAALDDRGDVYLWGPNDEGPSGGLDGDPAAEADVNFYPTKIDALDDVTIVEIQSGPNHLIAVDSSGTIYTFGSNSDGRLGYPSEGSTYEPQVVDLTGDAAPYLVSATPADNARDVEAGASVVLTFTEAVVAGSGEIRFVNRDDADDVLVVDVASTHLVDIDCETVTVTAPAYFTPDARYAVEIDAGAFEDASGQAYAGIAAGDTATFNFQIAETAVEPVFEFGTNGADFLRGTTGEDALLGNGGDDLILAHQGDDMVDGGAGRDTIDGGAGDDTLSGSEGADEIEGGAGADLILGGTNADRLFGEGGSDVMFGGSGGDRVMGGIGNDTMSGEDGADDLFGQRGEDSIRGGNGNDTAFGGAGDDRLFGDAGADVLIGDDGDDHLGGGTGRDTLIGGDGDDGLRGGQGADRFGFDADDGRDVIYDFAQGSDKILLAGSGDLAIEFDLTKGHSTLTYGETTVVVRNVDISSDDFEFVIAPTSFEAELFS